MTPDTKAQALQFMRELKKAAQKAMPGKGWIDLSTSKGVTIKLCDNEIKAFIEAYSDDWKDAEAQAEFIIQCRRETILALLESHERLVEALEFYADRRKMNAVCNGTGDDYEEDERGFVHAGKRAREALQASWDLLAGVKEGK